MEFYTKIAGVTIDNRQRVCRDLKVGQKLVLIPEPNNPFDSNAIAIFTEDKRQVGYIPAATAANMAPHIKMGSRYQATVSEVTGGGSYNYGVNILIKSL